LVAIILFISSVILYLSIRWAQLLGVPNQIQNLAMFAVPSSIFFVLTVSIKQSLSISFADLLLTVFAAIFLSYLGSIFSLKSLRLAPNPGYSLMISKSYVIFTAVVAVLLFRAELTFKSAFAIFLIVFGSALISLPKVGNLNGTSKRGVTWFLYALGAFFCWGVLALLSKYILSNGLNVFVYLFYLTLLVTVLISLEMYVQRVSLRNPGTASVLALVLISVFSTIFNLSMQYGYIVSPNIGYINAANASSISVVALFSVILFNDEFSFRKFVGIIGSTLGLLLLFI